MPNFYVLSSVYGFVAYPNSLEDPKLLSPESVLLWARNSALQMKVEFYQAKLEFVMAGSDKG